MRTAVFSLNAMLADMESVLRRLTTDSIDLAVVQAAGLWPVAAPPGKLEELLLALAVDACDAMAEGGGTLLVTTGNLPAPQGLAVGDAVALSVSHDARSVSESFRLALHGRGRREGLGIRLGYEIAEASGGRLDVLPATGGGTLVRLLLPRPDGGAAEAPHDPSAPLPTGTETILVVEDDKLIMASASRALARLGYGVLTAGSAEAALRLLGTQTSPVHLLLTDIMLPGLDGLALARQARAMNPRLKVLYMTGYSEEAMRAQGQLDKDAPLIEKPFTFRALAIQIRKALG